MKANINLN